MVKDFGDGDRCMTYDGHSSSLPVPSDGERWFGIRGGGWGGVGALLYEI